MGVPKYRSTLMKKFPECFSRLPRNTKTNCESLYVDFNPVIHEMAGWVFGYSNRNHIQEDIEEPSEELVYQKCWEFMFELLTTFNPQNTFFIAIDGVAPLAKQNQQRQRRYLSARDSSGNVQGFNPSCISVGTKFMLNLCEFLRLKITSYLEEYPDDHNCEIILSSDRLPGEGEHKIMEHIRKEKEGITEDIYIYGPDGDLLFLTLLSAKKVKLLTSEEMYFPIVDVDLLRTCIGARLCPGWKDSDPEYQGLVMKDYVLIGNLLGNDFLPKIKMFYHVEEGWELLIQTYQKNFGVTGEVTICQSLEDNSISEDFLQAFIKEISKKEVEFLTKQLLVSWEDDDPREDTLIKSFSYNTGESQELYFKGYQKAFYEKEKADVKKICKDYIQTLYWSFIYYCEGPPNWTDSYDFCEAPFLSDLSQTDFSFQLEKRPLPDNFTPIAQLVTILPYSTKNLVPSEYQGLYDPKNKLYLGDDFWVKDFEYDLSGKIEQHTGVVRIPPCDRDRVLKRLEKLPPFKPKKKVPDSWTCVPPDTPFRYKNKYGSVNVYHVTFA